MAHSTTPVNSNPAFWSSLTARQKQIFQALQKLLTNTSHHLEFHHHVGSLVREWQETVGDDKPASFKKLASALQTSTARLYKDGQFAEAYSLEKAKELEAQGCSWGMVEVVLHVTGKQERKKLLRRAVDEHWNLAVLKSAIGQGHGDRHAGGRPMRVPSDLDGKLQQLNSLSRKWLKFYQAVADTERSLLDELKELPAADRSDAMVTLLKEAAETTREMETAVRRLRQTLVPSAAK